MYKSKILAGFLLIILFSCTSGPSSTDKFLNAPLNGKIFDFDNLPCSGVLIKVNNSIKAKSDINGRFIIPSLAKGKHEFVLTKENYEELQFTFDFINTNQVLWLKMISLDQLIRLIEEKFDEKMWDEGEKLIERAQKINPRDSVVLYLTSVLYIHNKWYEKALEILLSIVESGEKEPIIYLTIGDIYEYYLNDPVKAREYLEKYAALKYDEGVTIRIENLRSSLPEE
jgi:tetratricopeptide (TPR) repeat protein